MCVSWSISLFTPPLHGDRLPASQSSRGRTGSVTRWPDYRGIGQRQSIERLVGTYAPRIVLIAMPCCVKGHEAVNLLPPKSCASARQLQPQQAKIIHTVFRSLSSSTAAAAFPATIGPYAPAFLGHEANGTLAPSGAGQTHVSRTAESSSQCWPRTVLPNIRVNGFFSASMPLSARRRIRHRLPWHRLPRRFDCVPPSNSRHTPCWTGSHRSQRGVIKRPTYVIEAVFSSALSTAVEGKIV